MELPNHVIDLTDMILQVVLLLLDPLIPDLRQQSLDVRLGFTCISDHLQISPSVLACEHVSLAPHDRSLLCEELFLHDVHPPVCLDGQRCIFLYSALLPLEVSPCHETFDRSLDAEKTTTHAAIS